MVLHITGCLEFSDPVRTVSNCFGHALKSVVEHDLEHEVLTGEEVNRRFPGWRLPPHFKVISVIHIIDLLIVTYLPH